MRNIVRFSLLSLCSAVALSGCLSVGGGGYPGGDGSYPRPPDGQGYPPQGGYPPGNAHSIEGSITAVDPRNLRFRMNDQSYGRGTVEVVYERGTPAWFRGQQVDPTGAEVGDRVRVAYQRSQGGQIWAHSIEVLQDVRASQGGYPPATNPPAPIWNGPVEGTVSRVDSAAKVLEFTRGGYSGPRDRVRFDDYTVMLVNGSRSAPSGQRYAPAMLESGDLIRIQGRPMGNEILAETITVLKDVRSR